MKDIFSNIEQQIENIDAKIDDIVKNATNGNHYEKLNQKINEMVNSSAGAFERGYERAEKVVKEQSEKIKSTYELQQEKIKEHAKETKKPVFIRHLIASKEGHHSGGLAMALLGFIFAGFFGMGILSMWFMNAITFNSLGFWQAINRIFLIPGFAICFIVGVIGCFMMARVNRFKKYIQTLGGKMYADVVDFALVTGKSDTYVQRDLQKMIHANWFKQGRLTRDKQTFILDKDTYDVYEANQNRILEAEQLQEANRQRQEQLPQDARFVIQKGGDFMKEVHEKKVAISDYDMTIKLTNLETILKKIFKRVGTHPETVPQMRKMMDYYLPTTIKLLDAYVQLDKQAIGGTNIVAAKTEIEASLDTLIAAYEKLLDDLFEDVMLDVSTDIAVLNTMLAQDGLTGNDFEKIEQ